MNPSTVNLFYKTFVIMWQGSKNIEEVCAKTGFDRRRASNTAATLRRKGVPLKSLRKKVRYSRPTYKMTRKDYYALSLLAEAERNAYEVKSRAGYSSYRHIPSKEEPNLFTSLEWLERWYNFPHGTQPMDSFFFGEWAGYQERLDNGDCH